MKPEWPSGHECHQNFTRRMRWGSGKVALLTQTRMSELLVYVDFYNAWGRAGQFLVCFEDPLMKTPEGLGLTLVKGLHCRALWLFHIQGTPFRPERTVSPKAKLHIVWGFGIWKNAVPLQMTSSLSVCGCLCISYFCLSQLLSPDLHVGLLMFGVRLQPFFSVPFLLG